MTPASKNRGAGIAIIVIGVVSCWRSALVRDALHVCTSIVAVGVGLVLAAPFVASGEKP